MIKFTWEANWRHFTNQFKFLGSCSGKSWNKFWYFNFDTNCEALDVKLSVNRNVIYIILKACVYNEKEQHAEI